MSRCYCCVNYIEEEHEGEYEGDNYYTPSCYEDSDTFKKVLEGESDECELYEEGKCELYEEGE
tara:strand:+ start:327 stop:515 length:189 start_codon:yes stop_codon:yes gene_type:complete